jgi:hypothetical protein
VSESTSVFAKYIPKAYPHQFAVVAKVGRIAGGTPTDPNVAESWLKTKIGSSDDMIRQGVAEIMLERGISADQAVEELQRNKHLNGFKRTRCADCPDKGEVCLDGEHQLYIEGRQMKAAIKEAGNVRWPNGRWSIKPNGEVNLLKKEGSERTSGKATRNWLAEHVFVQEDKLLLGVSEPDGVAQRFVHTFRGSGIQYEEYVDDVELRFTVVTDAQWTPEQWGLLWLTGEQQGIGASRSQGYGRYKIIEWNPIKPTERQS